MIFKQETIKSWFTGIGNSINNEVIQPFQNANSIISKYNLAIQHNSLTQQGWQRILAQSDDSLRAYLTNIKGTTASMSGYNVSLQGNITGFTKITKAIQQYNALSATTQKEQQAFTTAVGITNNKLGSYLTELNGAKANLAGYGLSLVASTAKTVGLTVATTALNTALTMGVSLIVSELISAFVSWIHKSEEITEKAQEAVDKINSINDRLKSNTETVENAKKRYAELAQEVENLGKTTQSQGSLSNEEYEEFLDLSNQLAGIFPSLTKHYDDNGNAILNLSGDVNTIVSSLDDLIHKEKELANKKIMEEFPDVFKGWNQDLSDAEQKVKNAKSEFDKINQAYSSLGNGNSIQMGFLPTGYNKEGTMSIGQYEGWLKDLGLTYEETVVSGGKVVTAIGDIDTAFTSKLEKAKEDLQYAQQQLNGQTSSINQYLNTWLQSEFSYIQIENNSLQTAIQDILFNFDWNNIAEDKRGDWNYVSEYLRRNILFEINKVQNDPVISKAFSEVFTNTELTPDEKNNYLQQIKDFFGESSNIVISLKPQIEETEALQKQYDDAIQKTKDKFDGYDPTAFFKEHSINTQEEIDAWQKIAQGARDATEAEQEYIQSLTPNIKTSNSSLSDRFKEIWDSESFIETKANLEKLAKESKITADDIYSLVRENETLSDLFYESGMSARFLAECFDSMCRGGAGFDAISSDALLLDQILNQMTSSLQQAKSAKSSYDEAMSKDDYNAEFKNYQEAYSAAMEMFKNGEFGNHFRDTMEYLLGEESYTMSIDELEKACKNLDNVFGEDATNGFEFLEKLYENKNILNDLDSSLIKLSDGSYDYDLKPEEFGKIADALGMTTEEIAACTNALGMFGDYKSYDLDELELAMNAISIAANDGEKSVTSLQGVENILNDLGYTGYDTYQMLQDIKSMGSVKLLDFEDGNTDEIISKLQQLELIHIDGNNINLDSLIAALQQLGNSDVNIAGFIERLNGQFNLTDTQGKLVDFETAKEQALSASGNKVGNELSKIGNNAVDSATDVSSLGTEIDKVNNKTLSNVQLEFVNVSTAAERAGNNVRRIIERINALNGIEINDGTPTDKNKTSDKPKNKNENQKTTGKVLPAGTVDKYNNLAFTGRKVLPKKGNNALQDTVTFNVEPTNKIAFGNKKASGNAYASESKTVTVTKQTNKDTDSDSKNSSTTGNKNTKKPTQKKTSSTASVDWIEKKLDRLQKKIDATKSKFDNLFTVKKKANNIDTQISQTEALLKATEKAAKKYKQYADKAELSKDLKKKVRDGDYNISDYSSGTADAINKYEGYYNKYKDLQKQAEELETDIRKKEEEKYRLYVDQADAKLEKSEAEAELVGKTYKEQAKYLKEQKKQIKDSYEYQIKIAERNGDKTEAAKLRAQQKKELRDKDVEGYRLRVDKQDAKLERSKAREALDEGNYKKQNVHLEYQKTFLEESYKWKIKIAKTNKDDIEAEKLKAELEKEIRDLTKAEFDNIEAEYDNRIRHTKDQMDIVNSQMEQLEAKGYVASRAFYSQLIAQENKNLSLLKEERKALQDQMNAGLKDGSIVEGTTAWYEMLESINEVDNATIQATTALMEYNNQLRQLEWDAFDRTQDYISEIQNESDFLLELISSKKLYDDSGQWTPYANAAAGLHAVSYNTYLSQADDYAREIEKINRQLADDPYNTALIKRKQELIHAQQEAIQGAENEKQAMQELVSDGYSAMTNALQKLVDKRKELLNSEKDLYDYEKKISAQTKEILNLEKQKLSLQGDDSEETQAKIQQITMKLEEARDDLEESEYEQWRADQEQLLDSLVDTVQEWVNQRLDNLEGLVSDVIASTNVNAYDIRSTLIQAGQDVGYKLTDEMEKIWDTSSTIVSTYGDSFSSQLTAVNTTLAEIRDFVSSMQLNSEKETIENTETNTGSGSHSKEQGSFNASANTMHTEAVSQSGSHKGSSSFSTVSGIRGEQPFKHTPTAERIHTAHKVQLLADAVRNLPAAGETVQHMAADPDFAKSDSFVHMLGISYTPEYTRFHEENRHIDNVNVNFTLPNISNYEEFSSSLIRDKSFERAIQNITFGNALGRNSLNKFRI